LLNATKAFHLEGKHKEQIEKEHRLIDLYLS